MGQRVYWSCVILVVMTLRQNRPESASARKLQELFGINRNTVKRWAEYFRDEFPASVQWRRIRGRVTPWVTDELLPGVLVSYFFDNFPTHEQALIGCLKFLASGLASIRGA